MENLTRSIVTRQPQSDPESSLEMTSETLPANRGHYGARAILPLVQGRQVGGCSVGFHHHRRPVCVTRNNASK
jgi:hypothetical protein